METWCWRMLRGDVVLANAYGLIVGACSRIRGVWVKREEAEIRCHGVQLKCFTYLPIDVKEHAGSCALGARVYFAKAVFEVGSVGKCAVGDSLFLITVRNCR